MCAFTGIRVRARAASLVWSWGARHLQSPFVTHTWVCVLYEFTTHLWVSGVCHLHPPFVTHIWANSYMSSYLVREFMTHTWVSGACHVAPVRPRIIVSFLCLPFPTYSMTYWPPWFSSSPYLVLRVRTRTYTCTRDCASHPVFLHTLERVRLKLPRGS